MQAGKLRHRVTIQEKSVTRDSFGAEVITWVEFAEVWGSVEPLRGREFIEGRQMAASVDHRVRIRQRSGISPEMRVSYDSRVFEIRAVLHVNEAQREMHLMCQEIV